MREWLHLKHILRTGWVRAGVDAPESVAAHSWGMSILAMHLCPEELDRMRVLEMCLVHDLPEVEVGDLTPAPQPRPASGTVFPYLSHLHPAEGGGENHPHEKWEVDFSTLSLLCNCMHHQKVVMPLQNAVVHMPQACCDWLCVPIHH